MCSSKSLFAFSENKERTSSNRFFVQHPSATIEVWVLLPEVSMALLLATPEKFLAFFPHVCALEWPTPSSSMASLRDECFAYPVDMHGESANDAQVQEQCQFPTVTI